MVAHLFSKLSSSRLPRLLLARATFSLIIGVCVYSSLFFPSITRRSLLLRRVKARLGCWKAIYPLARYTTHPRPLFFLVICMFVCALSRFVHCEMIRRWYNVRWASESDISWKSLLRILQADWKMKIPIELNAIIYRVKWRLLVFPLTSRLKNENTVRIKCK